MKKNDKVTTDATTTLDDEKLKKREAKKAARLAKREAKKQKDAEKKKKLLQDAIAPLEKCLAEYPEYSQKQKVVDNKSFLEKELAK